MNKLVKNIPISDLYQEFLASINGILGLTTRELQLLRLLIDMDLEDSKLPRPKRNLTDAESRKYICKQIRLTPDNLCRYIQKFRSKGILIQNKVKDEETINRILVPEIIGDRVQITIILKVNKDEDIND